MHMIIRWLCMEMYGSHLFTVYIYIYIYIYTLYILKCMKNKKLKQYMRDLRDTYLRDTSGKQKPLVLKNMTSRMTNSQLFQGNASCRRPRRRRKTRRTLRWSRGPRKSFSTTCLKLSASGRPFLPGPCGSQAKPK